MTTATEEVRICVMGHAGPFGTFARGERLRVSHPAVKAHPTLFCDDGIPESEWPTPFDHVVEAAVRREQEERDETARVFTAEASKNGIKLELPAVMVSTRDFSAYYEGVPTLIQKGSVVLADHDLVVGQPENWKPR